MLLSSPLLTAVTGVRHGFSTRQGGVSEGKYASWNFGGHDDPAALTENRRRFHRALSIDPDATMVDVRQVHGARIVDASSSTTRTEADGIVVSTPEVPISIYTADCAPILMAGADEDGRLHIAAVHAGWRGAVADIPGTAVAALASRGVPPSELRAAIGPTIGIGRFEVGERSSTRPAPPSAASPQKRSPTTAGASTSTLSISYAGSCCGPGSCTRTSTSWAAVPMRTKTNTSPTGATVGPPDATCRRS